MESTYLSWSPPGVYLESIRSLPGVHQEYQDFIRTPDGVHQDAWGSVTYSSIMTKGLHYTFSSSSKCLGSFKSGKYAALHVSRLGRKIFYRTRRLLGH